MNLGAMIDLGVDPEELINELKGLGVDNWSLEWTRASRQGVAGTCCRVVINDDGEAGHHPHAGHPAHHPHRTFRDIRQLIEVSALKPAVKTDAIAIFTALAEAEGAVHGKDPEEVHFHEVGALDSIIDIVGAAICWDLLKIDQLAASALELGGGTVHCAHGRMPVPAPATARLLKGIPVTTGAVQKETTTPTGAALLVGCKCHFGSTEAGSLAGSGIGVGQRDTPGLANVLYVSLLQSESSETRDEVVELATNLDDQSPEQIAFLVEQLLEAGALDAWQMPATFKKGRMGCVLTALVRPPDQQRLTEMMLRHSASLGVRWQRWDRSKLERQVATLECSLGQARCKTALLDGKVIKTKLEYDDLRRIALANGLSLEEVKAAFAKAQKVDTEKSNL
jgi:uncharacterized protein (TIGR00299 family) protein